MSKEEPIVISDSESEAGSSDVTMVAILVFVMVARGSTRS